MKYIYTVLIDNDEAVSCPTLKIAKRFISDFWRQSNESTHKFSIYNTENGITIEIKIKEYNTMKKQELFEKATRAMDNYTRAVEMGLFDFANYYESQMKEVCTEIRKKGLSREFEEFALVI